MKGFTCTFFAISAAVLRFLSRVCVWPAGYLAMAANWCERQAEHRPTERSVER